MAQLFSMCLEKGVYGREVIFGMGECGLQVPAVEFLEGDTGVGGQDSYCLGRVCDESVHDAAPYQGFVSMVLPQMFSCYDCSHRECQDIHGSVADSGDMTEHRSEVQLI